MADGQSTRKTRKILVADDDTMIIDIYQEIFGGNGYNLTSATDGDEALVKLREELYDVVITDLNMDRLNGFEFYERACREMPVYKNRFIFVTGDKTHVEHLETLRCKYILKPFSVVSLLKAVEHVAASSHFSNAQK